MKVIILAAGENGELGLYIKDKSKVTLTIANETILERQVRILKECGILEENIIVVTGYKKESIKLHKNITIIENDIYMITNNAYSLGIALQNIEEDIIVLDGDLVFEKEIILNLLSIETNILVISKYQTKYGGTGIKIDTNGYVSELGKHIFSLNTYESIMKICKKDVGKLQKELLKIENRKNWYTVPISKCLKNFLFYPLVSQMPVYDIDTYQDYLAVKKVYENKSNIILVTGASGFLGKKIYHILKRNYEVIGIKGHGNNSEFIAIDLLDIERVEAYITFIKPTIIIHTAGIAEPDLCEKNKEKAEHVNVEATKNIVNICKKWNIKLIHISTDYVFDGEKYSEYRKDDIRIPKNFYGITKVKAEDIVKSYDNSLIVRIPILYGYNDEQDKITFPNYIIGQLEKNKKIELDNIQIRYPVLIDEVADVIEKSLTKKGIIHITSDVGVTKYQWAKVIAEVFGYSSENIYEKSGTLFNRPKHIRLEITKEDYMVSDIIKGTQMLKKQLHCAFKLIYKGFPNETVYGKNIGKYRYILGKKLGKCIPKDVVNKLDYIVPVPTSGLFYAMGLAEELKIPYLQALVKTDSNMRSFQIADVLLREKIIREKIYAIAELIKEKTIAIVDEAIFTGTTLKVICDMLKFCDVKEIYICIPTPVCQYNCQQYIQPERKLLINNEIQDMTEYFKVDGVYFQNNEVFQDSIKDIKNICYECFRNKD
ncbi:MAG: sugar nucleotide-binding protein [Lachnospiraceae bacterium]|nr:sugar nucleotide-binding protein [Lachnospiraceae bacterium]